MVRVSFCMALDSPWTRMPAVAVGAASTATADVFVTVERDGVPDLRIDVYEKSSAHHAFREAIAWRDFVVIGYGGHVHLVALPSRDAVSHALSGYFGHLYALIDRLLVADAERLLCFDSKGVRIWRSEPLGIDGVAVTKVDGDAIEGEGEWDPPGGWAPFRISLASGAPIAR